MLDPTVPFFSNDWLGALKLVGTLCTAASTIVLATWRMLRSPLQATDAALQMQLTTAANGLTANTEALRTIETRYDTVLVELTRRADRHDAEIVALRENYSRIATAVDGLRDQSNMNKTEIVDHFQRRTHEMLTAMHELDKSVVRVQAVVEERTRPHATPSA